MGKAITVITKVHRVAAGLFLLSIVPAGLASAQAGAGGEPSPWVYLPLPFLFTLILPGTYQLVAPWVRRARARRGQGKAARSVGP